MWRVQNRTQTASLANRKVYGNYKTVLDLGMEKVNLNNLNFITLILINIYIMVYMKNIIKVEE